MTTRLTTGIPKLDEILGGGFLPGTVIIYGVTGVGKTILGITVSHTGIKVDGHPGIILDISKDLDDQRQIKYAKDFFDWSLKNWKDIPMNGTVPLEELTRAAYNTSPLATYYRGDHPKHLPDLKDGEAHNNFFRHHLPRTNRVIIDGIGHQKITPSLRDFLEYVRTRTNAKIFRNPTYFRSVINNPNYWRGIVTDEQVQEFLDTSQGEIEFGYKFVPKRVGRKNPSYEIPEGNPYFWDHSKLKKIGSSVFYGINVGKHKIDASSDVLVLLKTTEERNVFELANRPIDSGSIDAEVNTVIVMGYLPVTEQRLRQTRALAVIKHRGSPYDNKIVEYKITDSGIVIVS